MIGRRWSTAAGALFLAAGFPGAAFAEEATRLEPIVVTATRIEEKVTEQASAVSVVTREEIELISPPLVGDVLRRLPGVVVQRSGSPGNLENIRIRGGKSTQTLVMIDGFPMNSPTLGEFDISSLSPQGFERIEVVRGTQSALYGSNAMGGVVNFIPRKGEKGRQYGGGLAAGSFDTLKWNAFGQGAGKAASLHLVGSGLESHGILPNDDTSLVSFLGTGEFSLGRANRLHAIVFSADQEKGVPVDFFAPRDPNHRNDRRGLLAGARWETEVSKALAITASGSVFDEDFDIHDPANPGEDSGFDSLTRTRKSTFGLEAKVTAGGRSTTFVGAEYRKDRAENRFESLSALFGPFSSSVSDAILNRSLYLQEELRPRKGVGISLGARWDSNSVAGTQFNPRGAAFYTFEAIGVKVRAAVGRGFRAPTILEKTDPDAGNISLTSESAVSYEAGVDLPLPGRKGTFSATWFYQDFRDMIQFDNKFTFRLANVDAFARGLEAEAGYRFLPQLTVLVAYSYTETWDKTLQQQVLGVPKHRGAASLLFDPSPAWQGRMDWRIEGDQLDAPLFSGRTRRPGYAVVDAYTRYRWDLTGSRVREVVVTGKVQNLLDRDYEERIDNSAPGINFLLGAEVKI